MVAGKAQKHNPEGHRQGYSAHAFLVLLLRSLEAQHI